MVCGRGRDYYCFGHLSLRFAFYGLDRGNLCGKEKFQDVPEALTPRVHMPLQVGSTPKLELDTTQGRYLDLMFSSESRLDVPQNPKALVVPV